jgi:hypothetical protein
MGRPYIGIHVLGQIIGFFGPWILASATGYNKGKEQKDCGVFQSDGIQLHYVLMCIHNCETDGFIQNRPPLMVINDSYNSRLISIS